MRAAQRGSTCMTSRKAYLTHDDVIEFYSVFISLELDVRFLDQLLHLVLTFLDHCDFLQQQ